MAGDKTVVRIGRLVVESGRDADGREVARAIEKELRRLATGPESDLRARHGGRVEVPGESLELPTGTPAREIGSSVARTIWETGRRAARKKESR